MADRLRSSEPEFDLPREDGLGANIDQQVQDAQEQLQLLKRQQEAIEKQKRVLEELHQKQEVFERGKADMVEKLTRALVVLERQELDAHRRVDQLRATHESFSEHLKTLETINPNTWPQSEVGKELNRALSNLDNAKADFAQCRSRVQSELEEGEDGEITEGEEEEAFAAPHQDFLYWLKSGFAFTLPMVLVGLALLIWLIIKS